MACRKSYRSNTTISEDIKPQHTITAPVAPKTVSRLLFGVDSKAQSTDVLQNNIDLFEWVVRNKIPPNFYARYISGENALSEGEIDFIHRKGCKIAAIYADDTAKKTDDEGAILAKKIALRALELGIPAGTAIFLELGDNEPLTRDFMRGFAKILIEEGLTPAFKANTDAKFAFDREFSRGMQTDREIFNKCLIWAVSPTLSDYNALTTSHVIHPDNWAPYAPSAITRREIAIWQYGADCHPIEDNAGKLTTFNLDLVRNEEVILDKMF